MDSLKIELSLQGITAISIILGIGLVVWELRQQREFVETQHVSSNMARYAASLEATMGENSAASIAQACEAPDSLVALTHARCNMCALACVL